LEEHIKAELYKFKVKVESGEYISTKNLKFRDFVDDWYENMLTKTWRKQQ